MTLTIQKPSVKKVMVEVLTLKWIGVTHSAMSNFRCSACHQVIGQKRVAIVWINDEGKQRSLRLCEDCGIRAEENKKEIDRLKKVIEDLRDEINNKE